MKLRLDDLILFGPENRNEWCCGGIVGLHDDFVRVELTNRELVVVARDRIRAVEIAGMWFEAGELL